MPQQKKLNRDSGHRRAMLRNLATQLLEHERITTTEAKAKALQPVVEGLVTLGKRETLHARRQALAYILDEDVVTKLFETIGPRYDDRAGGYTRIVKMEPRRGDGAPMALIELV